MSFTAPSLNRAHIRPGDRICVAVSGGADSVALLLLLHEANSLPRNGLGVGLSAVHVHHGLRGHEADLDLEFVVALCKRLQVPVHVHHASVPGRIAAGANPSRSETIEEAARILRYDVFTSLIREEHADSVLTAHTLDDQAETVLMKLLRGAWTEGLSGIHPVVEVETGKTPGALGRSGRILRPLLSVRHADLEQYLRSRNQPWHTDSTNADQTFTRNRIRHHLLPILREYNPAVDQALANMAELARDDEARWKGELARILPQVLLPGRPVRGGGRAVGISPGEAGIAIEIERLRAFDPALRRRVIRAAARRLDGRLTFEETERVLALAGLGPDSTQPVRTGASIDLCGGLRAEKSARELRFARKKPPND
jgi:tRNA(Ile)-lysidine synthase